MQPQQPYQPYPQQGSGQYPYPQQAPTYGHPGDGYPGMYPSPQIVVRGDRNGLGTAALVLGITAAVFSVIPIVGLIAWPLSITGIILGFIGLSRVNQGEATNRGVIIGGLATSGAALAICFVWLLFLGFAGTASTANRAGVPTANSVPPDAAAPASKTDPQSSAAAPAKPAGPTTSFGDGTWVVGEDIQPGTYRSPGAKPGLFDVCSASTHTGDAADGSILDWKTANAGEPVRIKVSGAAKSVEVHGCETFTKVA
jgi:hypothetical protein